MSPYGVKAHDLAAERWGLYQEPSPRPRQTKRKRKLPLGFKLVVGGLLLTVGLVTFLPQYLQSRGLQEEMARLQEEKALLEAERQQLEQERVWLQTDEYIERVAREKLGLVRQGETQVIQVVPGNPRPLKNANADPAAFEVH